MIDLLDIISILLGGAVTFLMADAAAPHLRDMPFWIPLAMGVGAVLLLGYGFSESFHVIKGILA